VEGRQHLDAPSQDSDQEETEQKAEPQRATPDWIAVPSEKNIRVLLNRNNLFNFIIKIFLKLDRSKWISEKHTKCRRN